MTLFLLCVFAFLSGSVPYGLILGKRIGVDIRHAGSGNIGATNAHRVLGPKIGFTVFALDILKGFIPGMLARYYFPVEKVGPFDAQFIWFIVGIVAMLGHMFSPWLGFKGGKGIATGLGASIAAVPGAAAVAFVIMCVTVTFTRYISLGSLLAAWSFLPVSYFVFKDSPQLAPIFLVMSIFITVKHKSNIQRLRAGTESKFSFKKEKTADITEQKSDDQTS